MLSHEKSYKREIELGDDGSDWAMVSRNGLDEVNRGLDRPICQVTKYRFRVNRIKINTIYAKSLTYLRS
jgi:hypothetical protein